ncbi:MAG: BON domain-containing protein [Acidobacteria bacterium]|nr:BON domain-containing protein [Acidobacteriota bacterium]
MPRFSLVLLLLAAGAAAAPPPAHKRTAPGKNTPAPKMTDPELEKAIQARFARSKIAVNKFQVHVQGGVATIEGRTGVLQHKATATRLAKLAGARAVLNKVQASDEARRKAASQLAQGRRRAQIKRSDVERR